MKITALELSVLAAIDASEYGDNLTDAIWMFSVTDNMAAGGATPKQLPGVVSSLCKKGLVTGGVGGKDAAIAITAAGAKVYADLVGDKRRKYLD